MFLLRSVLSFLFSLILVTKSYCIVGGIEVSIGSLPYIVSIRDTANNHYCTGTIISKLLILTAATCVYDKQPLQIHVITGTNYLNRGGSRYNVSRIIAHNEFNAQNNQHDIALIEINRPITFNGKVQPINLSNISTAISGTSAIVSGWGQSDPSNGLLNSLHTLIATIISITDCQKQMPGLPIFNTQICTKGVFGQGASKGDRGGPLVNGNQQVGVLSWGIPAGKPNVYTSIYAYRKWLEQHNVVQRDMGEPLFNGSRLMGAVSYGAGKLNV